MKERPNEAATNAAFEFDALREARNLRTAMLVEFSPYLKGRVIEIGAGIGQITELVRRLPAIHFVQAIEPDPQFCDHLRKTIPDLPLIQGTINDLPTGTPWHGILSINVLEHIREDEAELRRYHEILRPQHGLLNLFVPARMEIYAPIDRDFGHHRRYSKAALAQKLDQAGFEIVRLRYFNFAGYFAWWAIFCVLRKRKFETRSVRLFDRVIFPAVSALETKIAPPPFGQSLLAVARAR